MSRHVSSTPLTRRIPRDRMRLVGTASSALLPMLGMVFHCAHAQSPEVTAESAVLGEVTVTAQKRAENLQSVPTAITALSGEAVEQLGITQAEDLTKISPAIIGTKAGGVITQYYVRGVGNYATNVFAEGAVATNLNGVNLSRPTTYDSMFFDLERIELLKGPQGTLYGRNATGGAVNLITRRPDSDFNGNVGIEGGDFGLIRVNGAVNVPVSDAFALRAAFQTVDRDGYLSDKYDDEEQRGGRLSGLFTMSDSTSLLIIGDYETVGGRGGGGAITPFLESDEWIGATDPASNAVLTTPSFPFTRGPIGDPTGFSDIEVWGGSAEFNWDAGSMNLTVLPAYRKSDVEYLSYAPGFLVSEHDTSDQTSIEIRLASDSGEQLQWVVGAFYFDEDTDSDGFFFQQVSYPPTFVLSQTENSTTNHFDLGTEAWAVFGQATFSLSDTWRLTAGGRYTSEDRTMRGTNTTDPPDFPFPIPPFTFQTDGDASWDKTTWKLGVEFDAAPENLLYASVSTGFKAGGFYSEQKQFGNTFDPEELTAYAIGSKNRFAGDRVQLNAEIFYWDYKDHQEPHLAQGQGGYTIFPAENIGQATMQGVDLEALFLATENDRITLQLQYLDAEFNEFTYNTFAPPPGPFIGCPFTPTTDPFSWVVNCDGKQAVRAPEWSGTLAYQHTFNFGDGGRLMADVRMQYASETYVAIDYLPASLQGDYTMSDASLIYESANRSWSIGAWVRNIEDEAVISNSFTSPFTTINYSQIRAPRTYGGNVLFKF